MSLRLALLLPTLSAVLSAAAADAASVTVQVQGADGRPLPGAVVMIDASARKPGGPIRFPWRYVMAQQNVTFQPHVLIVPVGASVEFPNRDRVRHHVYSFSQPKKFELKLYGQEERRSVLFDKPGIVAVGCNIHDAMSGFVAVVDTPFAAQTDTAGRATIAEMPEGPATLRIWHPSIRAPRNQATQPLAITAVTVSKTVVPVSR